MTFFRLRSFVLSLALLVSFIVYDTRNASAVIDPLTGYIAVSAVLHAVAIGGYYAAKYFKRENGGSRNASGTKITPSGTIGRDASVQWVDLTSLPNLTSTKDVTAKLSHDKIKSKVSPDSTKYPKLASALYKSSASTVSRANNVGDLVVSPIDGTVRQIVSKSYLFDFSNGCVNNVYFTGGTFLGDARWQTDTPTKGILYADPVPDSECGPWTPFTHWKEKIQITFSSDVKTAPKTYSSPSEFASALSGKPSVTMPENVYSDYYGEIDDMIKSESNIVDYVDSSDSSNVDSSHNFSPDLPSYSEYANAVAEQSSNAAIASAADAVNAANNSVNNALSIYNQTGNPADYQTYLDAVSRANELASQLAALQAARDARAADSAKDDESSSIVPGSSPSAYGDGSDFDFQARFSQFFDDVKATTLFSLPNKIVSSLPSGGSPIMSINCGRWGVHTLDFSEQSQLLSVVRTLLLIGFSFVAIKIVVLKGGGG